MDNEYAEIINDDDIVYSWNDQNEADFLKIRATSKKEMISIIDNSSWNSIAFSDNIQKIQQEINNQERRNTLLDKY